MAFREPTIALYPHIFRLSNRTNIPPGKDPLEVELRLLKFVPDEFKRYAHHWLILHGRYVCIARKPQCPACLIRDLCEYRQKTPEPVPAAAPRRSGAQACVKVASQGTKMPPATSKRKI